MARTMSRLILLVGAVLTNQSQFGQAQVPAIPHGSVQYQVYKDWLRKGNKPASRTLCYATLVATSPSLPRVNRSFPSCFGAFAAS
jgi:hypothetical protein